MTEQEWLTSTDPAAMLRWLSCNDDGTLDPDILGQLHDALVEAGCNDEAILRHLRRPAECHRCNDTGEIHLPGSGVASTVTCGFCRDHGRGPHVRGCWVVDLMLGRD